MDIHGSQAGEKLSYISIAGCRLPDDPGVRIAFSDKINSGYRYEDSWAGAEPGACEAPNVW